MKNLVVPSHQAKRFGRSFFRSKGRQQPYELGNYHQSFEASERSRDVVAFVRLLFRTTDRPRTTIAVTKMKKPVSKPHMKVVPKTVPVPTGPEAHNGDKRQKLAVT